MPGFHKRREYKYEGTVESIYLMDDMTVEVVADGIHVPPTILRLVYKIKGVERMCAITDALACAASDSKEAFDRVSSSRTAYASWPTTPPCRQRGNDGPPDTHNGTEGRHTIGGRRAYGVRNTGSHYGVYDRKGSLQKEKTPTLS